MKLQKWRNSKAKRILIVSGCIIVTFVILLAVISHLATVKKIESIPDLQRDTNALNISPYDPNQSGDTIKINLKDKRHIADGKYGFRKKIHFYEKTAIWISLSGKSESQCKDVRAGIYNDENLSDPIEETTFIDMGEESYAEAELGKSRVINETEDGRIVVEPGNYYVGLYTTEPYDEFTIEFQGWYGSIHNEYHLQKNQDQMFFVEGPGQSTYFKFQPDKSGKIEMGCYIYEGTVQLCDQQKNALTAERKAGGEYGFKITFEVQKDKTYYLKVSGVKLPYEMEPLSVGYPYRE